MPNVLSHPRGVAPRTPLHALSRAASPARSVRVARSLRSLATSAMANVPCEPIEPRRLQGARKCGTGVGWQWRECAVRIRVGTEVPRPRAPIELARHIGHRGVAPAAVAEAEARAKRAEA